MYNPTRCPCCNELLYNVGEEENRVYVWNKESGKYDKDGFTGDIKIICTECGGNLFDVFEDGICNYIRREVD